MGRGIGRWGVAALALVVAVGVGAWPVGRAAAASPDWEALGPTQAAIVHVDTPASGALFVATKEGELHRSDDGGVTWSTVARPGGTTATAVSPVDQQLIYAGGTEGIFRSGDGGTSWDRVSDLGGNWIELAISPADAALLYGVAVTSPPTTNGTNRWNEFRVSRDAGATWTTARTHHETIFGGQQPCYYEVRLVRPHSLSAARVTTIEGCRGRGESPVGGSSADAWATMHQIPGPPVQNWGASAVDGGRGVNPDRWYAGAYFTYGDFMRSKIVRSDDDGQTWTVVYEADGQDQYGRSVRPTDYVTNLAYDPARPDDLYAVFSHFEVSQRSSPRHEFAGFTVRRSRDGGLTWADDLGSANLPNSPASTRLTVGIDSRYLYAATATGLYRLALDE